MDQKKTGSFLKSLRTEKGITQEQVAEVFGVAGRTVSRWETGSNMPDLSILIEIAEFYDVDIREIIDGERKSENMNIETKETLQKVADYVDTENERIFKETIFICAINITLVLAGTTISLSEVFRNILTEGGANIFLIVFSILTVFLLMTSIAILRCVAQLKAGKEKTKISETDFCAMMSMILGVISILLIYTGIFWMVTAFVSVAVGLLALKNKTEKKRFAGVGILCSVISALIALVLLGIW